MFTKQLREARENDGGFTLIELLIVIVVLGVLAGIVVFGVSKFRTDSADAACNSTMKTIQIAEEAAFAKNGKYESAADLERDGYLKAFSSTDYTVTTTIGTGGASYDISGTVTDGGAACTAGTLQN